MSAYFLTSIDTSNLQIGTLGSPLNIHSFLSGVLCLGDIQRPDDATEPQILRDGGFIGALSEGKAGFHQSLVSRVAADCPTQAPALCFLGWRLIVQAVSPAQANCTLQHKGNSEGPQYCLNAHKEQLQA